VPVSVLRDGAVLRRTISQPPDGSYVLADVPAAANLVISATLQYSATAPMPFQITYGQRQRAGGPVAYAATVPFSNIGAANPLAHNIIFENRADITTDAAISKDHLDDLGAIYYHTQQAWQLSDRVLQTLDFGLPVDVVAFSTARGVSWTGSNSDQPNSEPDPFVNIEAAGSSSLMSDRNRPDNREWHEFGHHVMADTLNNLMPRYPRGADNRNHGSYRNVVTTDSWTEGFAEFYSMLVGREIAGKAQPELYRWSTNGGATNLESNFRAMTWNDEEFAVAGLLWDLVDPVDADDASVMTGTNGIPTTYADCVALDWRTFWAYFTQNYSGTTTLSPVAQGQGYGYLFDVKHLYDVLKLKDVGQDFSRGRAMNDLDELFVAHGFFADVSPMNRAFDAGETAGLTGYRAWNTVVGGVPVAVPERPTRRDRPPTPGSYIAFTATDAESGRAVDVRDFAVEVRFAPPFEHYSYSFEQHTDTPGRLYFYAADPQYETITTITPRALGYAATVPLTIANSFYAARMATGPADFFTEAEFTLRPRPLTYLPLVLRGGAPGSTNGSAPIAAPGGPQRLVAHTPRACEPGEPTPTFTVTRTPTPTATRTPTPTSSAQPTFTLTATGTATTPTATRTGSVQPTPTSTRTPNATSTFTATPTGTTVMPTPTPTGSVVPTSTSTATPTATFTPTATRTATATPTVTATVTRQCSWRDDFDTPTLNAAWGWVREDPTHWSLITRTGYLSIATQAGDLWQANNNAKNLLLLSAPGGDFEISTRVEVAPAQNGQQAVLLIYGDDDNYVRLDRAYDNGGLVRVVAEAGGMPLSWVQPTELTALYLKLSRIGTSYTGFYSADGAHWAEVGGIASINLPAARAGLAAWSGTGGASEIPANFDWFCMNGGTPGATPTPTVTPTPITTWQTIYADGFEGSFPGVWQRLGNPGWGRTNCKAAAGIYSVWAGGDGTGAVTPCVNNYPNNLNAWLIYGPFSLAGASAAEVTFQRWQRSEEGFDTLSWLASVDGQHFYGVMDSGDTSGWVSETFDLSDVYTLGDLRGQGQVWIAFVFQSDADINDVGVFLDEVAIRKR
jgi:hypothetical protein